MYRFIRLWIITIICASIYSCSGEQLLDIPYTESQAIAFDSYIVHTKGVSINNKSLADFGIIAYHTGVNNYDEEQRGELFMDNVRIIKKGDSWKPADKEYYWPNNTNLFSFFAYSPYHESSSNLTYNKTENTISLIVDTNGFNHVDFLYTHTLDQSQNMCGASGVNLSFDHSLTKITVSARLTDNILSNGNYLIKQVTIGDVYTEAAMHLGKIDKQTWMINDKITGAVVASIDNKMLTTAYLTNSYNKLFNDEQAFFLIPQQLINETLIYLDVVHPDGKEYRSEAIIKAPMDNQGIVCWKAGEAYDYRITYNGMESVSFSVECISGAWNDQNQEENIDGIYLNLSDYKLDIKTNEERYIYIILLIIKGKLRLKLNMA